MKKLLYSLVFLFFSISLFSQAYLSVLDPDRWGQEQGTIEEAIFELKPDGMYTEVGMTLTFSAKGTHFVNDPERQLEVELYFDLPEDAMMVDSWLWVEEDIVKADIINRWTARDIYEEIVGRRQDPSILYKNSSTSYELRIYPMLAAETRKVKLTYLIPNRWNKRSIIANLPTSILRSSLHPVPVEILVPDNNDWTEPSLLSGGEPTLLTQEGEWFKTSLEVKNYEQEELKVLLNHNKGSDVFLGIYQENDEKFYQMIVPSSELIPNQGSQKYAILVDFDKNNTLVEKKTILNQVKQWISTELEDEDQFNVFLSNPNIYQWSQQWEASTTTNLATLDEALVPEKLSNYSNLPSLLSTAIQFAQGSDETTMILFSNSDQWGDLDKANDLLEDIQAMNNTKIPFYIFDFQTTDWDRYQGVNRSYRGNEYFNENLTRMTGGEWLRANIEVELFEKMEELLNFFSRTQGNFDVYNTLQNGFCYGRHNINFTDNSIANSIIQVGRFEGTFPFIIKIEGFQNGQAFSKEFVVEENQVYHTRKRFSDVWYGHAIKELEGDGYSYSHSNSLVNQIIDLSISERVLSLYTAFLALEPGQGGNVCVDNCDDENITKVNEIESTDSVIVVKAFPNPFSESVTIQIKLTEPVLDESISFDIFDINGRMVKTFEVANNSDGQFEFNWDATGMNGEELPKGVYFFTITTSNFRKVMKLVYF